MNTISQIARFRQSVVAYSFRFGVPAAVRRFNVSRASVYRWRSRFNGQTSSLQDKSRRPHRHPNQHTAEELLLISNIAQTQSKRRPRCHFGLNSQIAVIPALSCRYGAFYEDNITAR